MFVTPAYAQAAAGGEPSIIPQLGMMVLIFAIIYFLMIRPQQKRAKEHQAMVAALRRGDVVVTSGGVVAKVTKAPEGEECEVEIADGVRVKLIKSTVAAVRSRTEPAVKLAKAAGAPAAEGEAKPSGIMSIFKKK